MCLASSFVEAAATTRQRDNRKVLLVFLHSGSASDFNHAVRTVLCDESVAGAINGQFSLWAGDTDFSQPSQLLRVLPVRTTPLLIALISVNATELKVVAACSGSAFTPEAAITVLRKAQEAQDSLMAEDEQFMINRILREQQDKEYEDALSREREVDEARQRDRKAQEEIQATEILRLQEKTVRNVKSDAEKQIKAELILSRPEPIDSTTLVVRLSNGVRIEKKFAKLELVSFVYDWVLCCGLLYPNCVDIGRKIHQDNFVLSTSYPPTKLDTMSLTLEDAGLVPNAVLVFAFLADEDSDVE